MFQVSNQHGFAMGLVEKTPTPFYYYDMDVLHATLEDISRHTAGFPYHVHYALKANCNPFIVKEIAKYGLGADLVSGGELKAALEAGFKPQDMNFSGVGKTDWEIRMGLSYDIGSFNVESFPELEVINQLADEMDKTAHIALRIKSVWKRRPCGSSSP